jgi:hypothetical protein
MSGQASGRGRRGRSLAELRSCVRQACAYVPCRPSDTMKWAAAHLPGLDQAPLNPPTATVPDDPGTATIPPAPAARRPDPPAGHVSDAEVVQRLLAASAQAGSPRTRRSMPNPAPPTAVACIRPPPASTTEPDSSSSPAAFVTASDSPMRSDSSTASPVPERRTPSTGTWSPACTTSRSQDEDEDDGGDPGHDGGLGRQLVHEPQHSAAHRADEAQLGDVHDVPGGQVVVQPVLDGTGAGDGMGWKMSSPA